MKVVIKFLLNAIVAWIAGLLFIMASLYFGNGSDFTMTDIMGFGVMTIIASGLLMLIIYLPSLYWLKRRVGGLSPRNRFPFLTGVVCNLPVFVLLVLLINRKMVASEALAFMVTFLIIGASFGFGFTVSDDA